MPGFFYIFIQISHRPITAREIKIIYYRVIAVKKLIQTGNYIPKSLYHINADKA